MMMVTIGPFGQLGLYAPSSGVCCRKSCYMRTLTISVSRDPTIYLAHIKQYVCTVLKRRHLKKEGSFRWLYLLQYRFKTLFSS
jgi:hypothetical protein